jgi:hypothetical protein
MVELLKTPFLKKIGSNLLKKMFYVEDLEKPPEIENPRRNIRHIHTLNNAKINHYIYRSQQVLFYDTYNHNWRYN